MAQAGQSAGSRHPVPSLRNIEDIKGPLRTGTLIHFDAKQWQQVSEGLPPSKARPKYGMALDCYPIPGGEVLAEPICIQNPCEICRARVTGFIPEGGMIFECVCKRDPRCPEDPPPPPPSPLCALAVRRVRGQLQLVCESRGCSRRCRLEAIRQNGRILISCRCA